MAVVDRYGVTLFCQSLLLVLVIGFAAQGLLLRQARKIPQQTDTEGLMNSDEHKLIPTRGSSPGQCLVRHALALAGGQLLPLQAENHYLRIHADRGSAFVLMRLGDAMEMLGSEAGWRVHRSFWGAADALA